jgi:Ribose 5-phosphate isomerase A (phosphoriboisomerase A)
VPTNLLSSRTIRKILQLFLKIKNYKMRADNMDYSSKKSSKLGEKWSKGVPIEVLPCGYTPVANKIQDLFGGVAELRMAKMKAVKD